MKVYELGEFGLIERIFSFFGDDTLFVGIGDDSALIPSEGKNPLISVDSSVEGVHFRSEWGRAEELGRRALLSACSDILAMAGYVSHFFLSLVVPLHLESDFLFAFLSGMRALAREGSFRLAGGNVTRGSLFELHITVVGFPYGRRVIFRWGAKPGDVIMVTGRLGGASAGHFMLENPDLSIKAGIKEGLISRFLNPPFRAAEAEFLSRFGGVSSMIDISDGLYADLEHLVRASCVGAKLDTGAIPLYDGVEEFCSLSGLSTVELACGSGEEYELLFTVAQELTTELLRKAEKRKLRFTPIGRIISEPRIYPAMRGEGKKFTHF